MSLRSNLRKHAALGALATTAGLCLAGALADKPPRVDPVRASLVQGAAWIWPGSNGPLPATGGAPTYRVAAVLAESLVLRSRGVERGRRSAPLPLPQGVGLLPVVHVEASADAPNDLRPEHTEAILAAVRRQGVTAVAGAGMLQLDFEAPTRQRQAYRALVASVREALPPGVRLSVTALAHWCTQGWLDTLPVDEVVPMLYRLGPHAAAWRARFVRNDPRLSARCRGNTLGFATNDPPPAALLARATRPYWFDEAAWSNPSRPAPYLLP